MTGSTSILCDMALHQLRNEIIYLSASIRPIEVFFKTDKHGQKDP